MIDSKNIFGSSTRLVAHAFEKRYLSTKHIDEKDSRELCRRVLGFRELRWNRVIDCSSSIRRTQKVLVSLVCACDDISVFACTSVRLFVFVRLFVYLFVCNVDAMISNFEIPRTTSREIVDSQDLTELRVSVETISIHHNRTKDDGRVQMKIGCIA